MDVADYAKNQDSGSIRSSCHIMPPKCGEKPCMHGGKCTEGWNRFICDCTETSFTGPTCGRGEFNLLKGHQTMDLLNCKSENGHFRV